MARKSLRGALGLPSAFEARALGRPRALRSAFSGAGAPHRPATLEDRCQNPNLLNPTSVLSHRIDLLLVRGAIGVEQAPLVRADPEERIGGLRPSDHAGGVAKLTIADGPDVSGPLERRCPHRRTCARLLRDASLRPVPAGAGLGSA